MSQQICHEKYEPTCPLLHTHHEFLPSKLHNSHDHQDEAESVEVAMSVLMDIGDSIDHQHNTIIDQEDVSDVLSCASLRLNEDVVQQEDETDVADDVTYVGEPTNLLYSPDPVDHDYTNQIYGRQLREASRITIANINTELTSFEEAALAAAIERQKQNPELQSMGAAGQSNEPGYDVDRFFATDCEHFLEASEEGDLDEMKDIVNRYNSNPIYKLQLVNTAHEEEEYTALHLASENGWLDIVEYLIDDCGMTATNRKNVYGCTAFHLACIHAYTETSDQMAVIFYLLRQIEIFIDDITGDGMTVLHSVAKRGNMKLLKHFIDVLGADYSIRDDEGCTPLYYATLYSGRLDVVRYLIGLNTIMSEELFGRLHYTYVHIASMCNQLEVVKYWIDNWEVDIHAKDGLGRTALHCAAEMGSCDIMQYLARLGIDVNIADADGHTALHHVAHDGRIDMVKFFVEECGANIYVQNKHGKTPRHQTCSIPVAKYLDDLMSKQQIPRGDLTPVPPRHPISSNHVLPFAGNIPPSLLEPLPLTAPINKNMVFTELKSTDVHENEDDEDCPVAKKMRSESITPQTFGSSPTINSYFSSSSAR